MALLETRGFDVAPHKCHIGKRKKNCTVYRLLHSFTSTVHGIHRLQSVSQTPPTLLLHWPLLPKPSTAIVSTCLTIHQLRRSRFKPSFKLEQPWRQRASKFDLQAKLQARAANAAASIEARPSSQASKLGHGKRKKQIVNLLSEEEQYFLVPKRSFKKVELNRLPWPLQLDVACGRKPPWPSFEAHSRHDRSSSKLGLRLSFEARRRHGHWSSKLGLNLDLQSWWMVGQVLTTAARGLGSSG
ncbi:hypothetical protein NL676_007517 [Syzygium grande]|nr:hypothetical protein NL676_007517 [Syzygium grande]